MSTPAEFAHSIFLTRYLIFSSWHFAQSLPFPSLAKSNDCVPATNAVGWEKMQVHQPTTPLDEAPIFAPPTNAPASPIPLKQMIQRSDGRNCYPENRSLGARMASLLLPLVYLVSHSTLRSPPVLAVPPLLPDSPTDLHFPDASKQVPALGSEKSSRNPLTGVGIHIGSEVYHRKP